VGGLLRQWANKGTPPDLDGLDRCAQASQDSLSNALLAAPLSLLLDDLRNLQSALVRPLPEQPTH